MHKIAMLGTGLIGRFYTMSLQNFRGKDEIKIVCSNKLENAKKIEGDLKRQETGTISQRTQWARQG